MDIVCQLFNKSGKPLFKNLAFIFVTVLEDGTLFKHIQASMPDVYQHFYVIAFFLAYGMNPPVTLGVKRAENVISKEKTCNGICAVNLIDKEGAYIFVANGKLATLNTDLLNEFDIYTLVFY